MVTGWWSFEALIAALLVTGMFAAVLGAWPFPLLVFLGLYVAFVCWN